MVREKETKISALVYVATAIALCFAHVPLVKVGICKDCTWTSRLLHPFFHANIFHALVNCWALLSVVFIFDLGLLDLALSYAVAITVPVGLLGLTVPTVGCSGALYYLFGMLSFRSANKLKWHLWWLFFIGIGFFFPSANAILHLWCYGVGVFVGFLNSPAR